MTDLWNATCGRPRGCVACMGALITLGVLAGSTAWAQSPAPGTPPTRPAAERPAAERPATEQPAAERPAAERPAAERTVATPRKALAKPRPWEKGVSMAKRAEARKLLIQGAEIFGRGAHAAALKVFLKAVAAWDHPAIRYNIARCYWLLSQPVKAYENLKLALKYGAAPFKKHRLYSEAMALLKMVEVGLGRLRVVCKEPGAKVTLDGQDLFTAPGEAERVLKPGRHQLVASKKKFLTSTKTIILLPGKTRTVSLKLLTLKSAVQMKRRWKRWMPWTVLSAGAATALIGLPLFFTARSDYKKFDQKVGAICGDLPLGGCTSSQLPDSTRDIEKSGDAKYYSSLAFFALGGAVAAAGVVLIILNQPRAVKPSESTKPAPPKMSVLPVPLPGGGMLNWSLRF